jgi:hypothetical protein
MLILHISDIHFRAGNPDLDPDLPYRTILLNHVRDFVEKSGGSTNSPRFAAASESASSSFLVTTMSIKASSKRG